MIVKSSASLKNIVTIQIGGSGDIFYPESIAEFKELLIKYPTSIIIGGGSNTYFHDKKYQDPIIVTTKLNNHGTSGKDYYAETGVRLQNLFSFATGVPATVGGALYSNFGAFGKEIKDYLKEIILFDLKQRKELIINSKDFKFGYRSSLLKDNKNLIVLKIIFNAIDPDNNKEEYQNKRKNSQPIGTPNSGSVFKNPAGKSAGELIDNCNLKKTTQGDMQVWENHANVIINKGNGSAKDLTKLLNKIKNNVLSKYNIELEEEIECKV